MRPAGFVASKISVALIIATGCAALVYAVGAGTGARADSAAIWVGSFLLTVAGAGIFALYGMGVGMAFKSETALGIASGGMVFFAFFGNVFMPLSGTMLDIARFTPMYGYAGLVRFPLTEGFGAGAGAATDTLGVLVANLVAWTLLFALFALRAVRRSRARR